MAKERAADFKKWKSPALILSPATNAHGDGRLNPRVINTVFNEVCSPAGVEGHTPHDACPYQIFVCVEFAIAIWIGEVSLNKDWLPIY